MLPLWLPPHPHFKTSADPSLVPVLNFIPLSAWAKQWSYLRDLVLPCTSVLMELCCNQSTSSVTWGPQSTTRTPWNWSLTFTLTRLQKRLVNFVHVFGWMAPSISELKSRCTWPVLSVCYSMVVKRGQHTGTKNAIVMLFTCIVSALSWGCPGRTMCPILQYCKRLVLTTSYPSSDIDMYDRLGMCARWRTTACQSKFYIVNYRNAPQPIRRPKLHFQDVLKHDLNAYSITSTSWEKLACNKREWKLAIETGKQTSKK